MKDIGDRALAFRLVCASAFFCFALVRATVDADSHAAQPQKVSVEMAKNEKPKPEPAADDVKARLEAIEAKLKEHDQRITNAGH